MDFLFRFLSYFTCRIVLSLFLLQSCIFKAFLSVILESFDKYRPWHYHPTSVADLTDALVAECEQR